MSDTLTLPDHVDDMFCFAVYTASHAINRSYAPLLKELGLTYPQYVALLLLEERGLRPVSALSKAFGMDSNTMTPLLKRLEAMGYVDRERSTEDERQVIVSITSAGAALIAERDSITRCMVAATEMSPEALDTLVASLQSLRANLNT